MSALVRGELIKLRTTRTALGSAAAAALLVLATVLIVSLATDPDTVEEKRDALNIAGTLSITLVLFGIVGATGEYRHKTLAPALLIAPIRARLTSARVLAHALAGLLVGLIMLGVALALGLPLLAGAGGPDLTASDLVPAVVGGLITTVLATIMGVGIGVLVRNQVAAVVGALVWFFILEQLVPLISSDAARFTFGQASTAAGGSGQGIEGVLPWGAALGVVAVWALVFIVAGILVDRRRDVT